MNINSNGYRFTNETYATKKEVQKTLNISLIDKIWSEILEYRSLFTVNLSLKNIDSSRFSICLAPNMVNRLNVIERKINKFVYGFNEINSSSFKTNYINSKYLNALRYIKNSLNIDIDDDNLGIIASRNVSALTPDKLILDKYVLLLNNLFNISNSILIPDYYNYLVNLNSELLSKNDVFDLYRSEDMNSTISNYNGIYEEAPHEMLESLMDELFNFISNSNQCLIIKIIAVIFYISYIKPFNAYNEEFGVLFAKYIAICNDLKGSVALIDFEFILENNGQLSNIIEEVQKTNDLTYLLDYFINKLDSNLDRCIDDLIALKKNEVKIDYYKDENNLDQEMTFNEEDVSKLKVNEIDSLDKSDIQFTKNTAIKNITLGYSDREAKIIEEDLLESNPNLSRGQAYFYSRHCTLGKYYTISQYKKEVSCAYETARTSMDKLVSDGYYAKESFKKKYLYTPIKRK